MQPGNEIWPVYVTLQDSFYQKILWKMWPEN